MVNAIPTFRNGFIMVYLFKTYGKRFAYICHWEVNAKQKK